MSSQALFLINVFALVANLTIDSDAPFAINVKIRNNVINLNVYQNNTLIYHQQDPECTNGNSSLVYPLPSSSSVSSSTVENLVLSSSVSPPPAPVCAIGIWNNTASSQVPTLTRTCDFQINYCSSQYNGYSINNQYCEPFPSTVDSVTTTVWSGYTVPFYGGDGLYTFNLDVDDGAYLLINNMVVIDASDRYSWIGVVSGSIDLLGNMSYPFVLKYYNAGGGGAVMFSYNPPDNPNANILVNVTGSI